jgi:dolichol-phosphate mannosyltransferase
MKTLTALIPFFNEERTLRELVRELDALPKGVLTECIFIDDGSTDSSQNVLREALLQVQFKSQIISKKNEGKASAIREGSKILETSHAVILDSDLEYSVNDIQSLWQVVLLKKSDYVFGYRKFYSHTSFTWRYSRGNQLISNIYGLLFNEVITDIMSGYKLIPSNEFKTLPFKYKNFGIEVELPMRMWERGVRPYEIEISYSPRNREEGKSITVKDAISTISIMLFFRLTHRKKIKTTTQFFIN